LAYSGQSRIVVLDPFAGSGTTLLAAANLGCDSYGWEAQEFIFRIADAKMRCIDTDPEEVSQSAKSIVERSLLCQLEMCIESEPQLLQKCYSEDVLIELRRLQKALYDAKNEIEDSVWKLLWLALVSTLRPASHVGTAQWQFPAEDYRAHRGGGVQREEPPASGAGRALLQHHPLDHGGRRRSLPRLGEFRCAGGRGAGLLPTASLRQKEIPQ